MSGTSRSGIHLASTSWPPAPVRSRAQGTSVADPRESPKVLGVDAERDSCAGLRTQRLHHRVTRGPENLDLRRRVERLRVGLRGPLTDHAHVELHRCCVGMDLHDRHFGALRVDVLVEGEQTWLTCLEELDEA